MTTNTWVGRPLRRVEDRRFITGRGRYVDDVLRPNLLHLAFVRSPHAHARIVRLELEAARAAPGVVKILPAGDLPVFPPVTVMPFVPSIKAPMRTPLAGDTVHMVGTIVASLSPFGVETIDMPLAPEKIWRAINGGR